MWNSFFGSFFGFLFALSLFIFKEKFSENKRLKNLRLNVEREIEFGKGLLGEFDKQIDEIIRQIPVQGSLITVYLKYSNFRWHFLNKYYEEGGWLILLNDKDLGDILGIVQRYNANYELYVNKFTTQRNEGLIDDNECLTQFEYEKRKIGEDKRTLERIQEKLE